MSSISWSWKIWVVWFFFFFFYPLVSSSSWSCACLPNPVCAGFNLIAGCGRLGLGERMFLREDCLQECIWLLLTQGRRGLHWFSPEPGPRATPVPSPELVFNMASGKIPSRVQDSASPLYGSDLLVPWKLAYMIAQVKNRTDEEFAAVFWGCW